MLKILIATGIFPPAIGGPATYSALLAKELPASEYNLKILTYGGGSGDFSGRPVYRVSDYWPKGIRHLIYFLKILLLGINSDLVFAADSSFGAGFIAAAGSKLIGKPFLVRVTGDYAWEQGQQRFGVKELIDEFQDKKYNFFIQALRRFQGYTVRSACRVIAPSDYLGKIISGWGVPAGRIEVVYNSFDPIKNFLSKREARSRLNLDGLILVSAGRLVPWKGFSLLIAILERLRERHKNLKLFIIGSGPQSGELREEINRRDLQSSAILTGNLSKSELEEYLAAADIFLLNTAYEGFSHQLIEALHAGLPVITTNVGGNPEIIDDGKNGLLLPYNDFSAWTSEVQKLLEDEDLRRQLSREAAKSSEKFSKEQMILKLKKILQLCGS